MQAKLILLFQFGENFGFEKQNLDFDTFSAIFTLRSDYLLHIYQFWLGFGFRLVQCIGIGLGLVGENLNYRESA